jgi:DNA/RNA-binding domain of Phe-tRNA-synthetase-like protein
MKSSSHETLGLSQILAVTLPMLPLTIAPEFKSKIPNVVVGRITASVRNSQHDEALWQEIEAVAVRFRGVALDEARKSPPIKALRDAYRALGNDPTRCRGSNEALVRRISQGKDLHRVNTVADINNLVSLQTLHSAGTFDLDRVQPPIIFRVGQPGEVYAGIGRGEIKIEGLPVFADQAGPFGSTTSDSERTMVQLDTTRIMTVIISFLGTEGMDVALQRVAGLLARYAAATGIETGVVA